MVVCVRFFLGGMIYNILTSVHQNCSLGDSSIIPPSTISRPLWAAMAIPGPLWIQRGTRSHAEEHHDVGTLVFALGLRRRRRHGRLSGTLSGSCPGICLDQVTEIQAKTGIFQLFVVLRILPGR